MSELNVSKKQNADIVNLVQLYNKAKGNKAEFNSLFEKSNYNYNDMSAEDIYTNVLKPLDTNEDNSVGKISSQEMYDEATKKEEILKNIAGDNFREIANMSPQQQLSYFITKYGDKPTAVQKQAEFNRALNNYDRSVEDLIAVDILEDYERKQEETLNELQQLKEENQKEDVAKSASEFGLN